MGAPERFSSPLPQKWKTHPPTQRVGDGFFYSAGRLRGNQHGIEKVEKTIYKTKCTIGLNLENKSIR